jgi:hypothetical protein
VIVRTTIGRSEVFAIRSVRQRDATRAVTEPASEPDVPTMPEPELPDGKLARK